MQKVNVTRQLDGKDFNSVISLIHLCQSPTDSVFSWFSRIRFSIRFPLDEVKLGSNCCQLPLEAPEEQIQEGTVSRFNAKRLVRR